MRVIIDTNVLLKNPDILNQYDDIILPIAVIEELDGIKKSESELGFQARRASKAIENCPNIQFVIKDRYNNIPFDWNPDLRDNKIILTALEYGAKLISDDLNVRLKSKAIGVETEAYTYKERRDIHTYNGYIESFMNYEEQSEFYTKRENNWGLTNNEYLVIKDSISGEIIDKLKWNDSDGFHTLNFNTINSEHVGKVKPRNIQQELYTDMLQDEKTKVKIVTGVYGSGKDYLALANFLNLVKRGKYEKIVWVRNNVEVDSTKPIGFLPGTLNDKLSVFADIVSDFVGGRIGFERLIEDGKIELVHTGFLRGRDIRNSIIYCTESQNMTKELVQLIVSRVSEGSIAFFNGDIKQTDSSIFKNNNGLSAMIDKFKGHPLFAYVKLEKTERSEIAEMAKLLD